MHMLFRLGTLAGMSTPPAEIHEAQIDFVRRTIEKSFPHATALGRAAGVPQSSFSRLFSREDYVMSASTVRKIAAVSEVPLPPSLKILLDQTVPSVQERKVNVISKTSIRVWGCHPTTRLGEFFFNAVSMQSLHRPLALRGSESVVCFYAPDDHMAPRWMAGEPVFVDLMRSATAGDFVLCMLSPPESSPNDTETGVFRRLDGRSGGQIHFSALADDIAPMSFPLARVTMVRRILRWDDIIH